MEEKANNILKVYGFIGKVLCGVAGGILGYFIDGSVVMLSGAIIGFIAGHFFEKSLLAPKS